MEPYTNYPVQDSKLDPAPVKTANFANLSYKICQEIVILPVEAAAYVTGSVLAGPTVRRVIQDRLNQEGTWKEGTFIDHLKSFGRMGLYATSVPVSAMGAIKGLGLGWGGGGAEVVGGVWL